jgi:hypothetical protein
MDTHDNTMANKPLEERLLLQANGIVWLLGEQELCEQAYIIYREELKITIEYKELIALCEEAQQHAHYLQPRQVLPKKRNRCRWTVSLV